jgi:hypothetical protein
MLATAYRGVCLANAKHPFQTLGDLSPHFSTSQLFSFKLLR